MKSGESRAEANRRIRKEAVYEQLKNAGLLTQVIEDANKLADLEIKLDSIEATRIKAATDIRLKLLNKYIPDLKSTELTGDPEAPLEIRGGITFQGVKSPKGKK